MTDFMNFPSFPPAVNQVLETVDSWSFDARALYKASNGQPLKYLVMYLFLRYGFIQKYNLPISVLTKFLSHIENGHNVLNAAYHNTIHATEVTQTMHYILTQIGLEDWTTDLETFASLFAATIHSFEHSGFTNGFLVMTNHSRAKIYNDQSPNENYQVSAVFRLLKNPKVNFLANMDREDFRSFRALVIDMVLNTDPDLHQMLLRDLGKELNSSKPEIDKTLGLSLTLHTVDILNSGKHWPLHCTLIKLGTAEYFNQGAFEKNLGIPVCPRCDRETTLIADSEIEYIKTIAKPMVKVFSEMAQRVLEKSIEKPWLENFEYNLEKWEMFRGENHKIHCN